MDYHHPVMRVDWPDKVEKPEVLACELIKEIKALSVLAARLETENWQLKQALGYPIPADRDFPNNPFKCGPCEARREWEQHAYAPQTWREPVRYVPPPGVPMIPNDYPGWNTIQTVDDWTYPQVNSLPLDKKPE